MAQEQLSVGNRELDLRQEKITVMRTNRCLRNRKHVPCFYRVTSSYRNTSGSLGEREMLWEHEPQASVSTVSSSSPKLSRVFL